MQLQKVREYFDHYRRFLEGGQAYDRLYLWESQRIFQENWDLEAPDLALMYDRSLQSTYTRRHWKREAYEPKKMMMAFMGMEPGYVRQMFKDLFNENKEIVGRADRFVFHCDQLLQEFRKKNPRSIENNHYHDDHYQILSLYLAFRFPDQYTLFDPGAFRTLLEKLGSRDLPAFSDFGRFCKVVRTLYGLMQKEEGLPDLHRARLDPRKHYQGESLLVVYDFYQFCTVV